MANTLSHQVLTEVITFVASGAIVRYRAVKLHTVEGEVIETTDNQMPIGISLETVADGEQVRICTAGIAPCTASEAIALHAIVHPGGTNGIINDDLGTGEFSLGFALRAATAANDIIPVKINIHEAT